MTRKFTLFRCLAPSAPPPSSSEPIWTGRSPLTNGSDQQHQHQINSNQSNYRGVQFPPQQQAVLVRQGSANDTADSGIHSVLDGESSAGTGTTQSTLENVVVVESQARRAELVDHKTLDRGPSYPLMENIVSTETYVNKDRHQMDQAPGTPRNETKMPNGPITALVGTPTTRGKLAFFPAVIWMNSSYFSYFSNE